MNCTKAEPIEYFALGKLSTRESLIGEIQEQVRAELRSQSGKPWRDRLNGSLGEQIAIAAGSWDLALAAPVDVAEGVCTWLEKTFLQSPQGFGPRAESSGSPSGVPPKTSDGGGDGSSRIAAPIHLPHLIAHEYGISNSEARRLIQLGSVAIDGEQLGPEDMDLRPELVDGHVLRIGRRRGKRIDLGRPA